MMGWLQNYRAATCKHNENSVSMPLNIGEYEVLSSNPEGATLNWDGRVTVQNKTTYKCHLCGGEFVRHTVPHPRLDRTPRNERGWPINADGTEMQIVKDTH